MGSRLEALRTAVVAACHALGCTPNELVGWPSPEQERRALEERLDDLRLELADSPHGDSSTSRGDRVAISYEAPPTSEPQPKQAADPTKPRRGMNPERDAKIRELCEAGHSAMAIARRVGMTDMGVRMACQRMGLTPTTSRPKTTSTGT